MIIVISTLPFKIICGKWCFVVLHCFIMFWLPLSLRADTLAAPKLLLPCQMIENCSKMIVLFYYELFPAFPIFNLSPIMFCWWSYTKKMRVLCKKSDFWKVQNCDLWTSFYHVLSPFFPLELLFSVNQTNFWHHPWIFP